jgi:hypothetical protein
MNAQRHGEGWPVRRVWSRRRRRRRTKVRLTGALRMGMPRFIFSTPDRTDRDCGSARPSRRNWKRHRFELFDPFTRKFDEITDMARFLTAGRGCRAAGLALRGQARTAPLVGGFCESRTSSPSRWDWLCSGPQAVEAIPGAGSITWRAPKDRTPSQGDSAWIRPRFAEAILIRYSRCELRTSPRGCCAYKEQ